MEKRVILIIVGITLLICLCACLIVAAAGFVILDADSIDEFLTDLSEETSSVEEERPESIVESNGSPDSTELMEVTDSTLPAAYEGYELIKENPIPLVNLGEVYVRLGYLDQMPKAPSVPLVPYNEGNVREFVVSGDDNDFTITASLEKSSEHVMVWVEEGLPYESFEMTKLVNEFEEKIYPLNQRLFGSEWSPGIDGDPRIVILYAKDVGEDTAGYYSSDDQIALAISEKSNVAEMFVLNANVVTLGDEYTLGTLAHEYQHMIHWYADGNEAVWFDEGFAELAAFLGGYQMDDLDHDFLQNPDFQLNTWDNDNPYEHYGASFSFVNYLYNRLGEGAIKQLVQSPLNGFESIDAYLKTNGLYDQIRGKELESEDLVLDWMLTNYLLDESLMDGRFSLSNYDSAPQVHIRRTVKPEQGAAFDFSVHQFGADYFVLDAQNGFDLHFDGADLLPLLDTTVEDGDFAYWSQSTENSAMVLMREFDLSTVSGDVTMTFDAWFDLEDDYDFVYLMASDNGGATWDVLDTTYGNYFDTSNRMAWTGFSRRWVQEEIDLSAYAGKQVLIRFEYITDSVLSYQGMMVDNLAIPAIGYETSFEESDASWIAEGFVRTHHALPQIFSVAAIIDDGNQKMIKYLTLDAGNQFDFSIEPDNAEKVTFVISGATRFVTDKANYSIKFR